MLPSGKRRAIWSVTLNGPRAGGGLHDDHQLEFVGCSTGSSRSLAPFRMRYSLRDAKLEHRYNLSEPVLEAKSGSQGFDAAVAQLRLYRRARQRRAGARYLVWGIVEQSECGAKCQLDWLQRKVAEDVGEPRGGWCARAARAARRPRSGCRSGFPSCARRCQYGPWLALPLLAALTADHSVGQRMSPRRVGVSGSRSEGRRRCRGTSGSRRLCPGDTRQEVLGPDQSPRRLR